MVLGFLAVEGPGHRFLVMIGERDGGRGDQRDALVSRAEQHVVRHARALQRGGVALPEHG